MGALFSRIKTWGSTEDVVYSDFNAEFDNILNNLTAANVDDFSTNVSQMQTTTDPGEVGTESLATSIAGEISRLRFMIAEITGQNEWYESPSTSLVGLANIVGSGLTDNRIISGRVRSSTSNNQPIFLVPNGAAKTVTVKGSTTNFVYSVDGVQYTISTDVNLTGLTAAPSSSNTCLVNDGQANDDTYTKYTGENGSIIPVDNMGTEISSLIGSYAAFKLAGAATEYFIAYVESSTALSKAYRGYFFDSADAPVSRTGYTDNDVITLMKLTWIFAKTDGTLTATYNNPKWLKDEPTSPSIGDYWYDIANSTWKVYSVGSFAAANATLIGVCFQDTTNTVGARSFEAFGNYGDENSYELFYESATQVKSRSQGSQANVYGEVVKSDKNLRTWDITLDRDSGVSEGASTYYYCYLTDFGDVIISDVKPYDRREDLRGYYHPYASWRCIGEFFNNASSNISSTSVNSYFSRFGQNRFTEASAFLKVEVLDKIIRFSGASASEYLPPAAKTKGQDFVFIHNGTSLTQVYTLTGFGSELIGSANTYGLYTTGENLRIMSDGSAYIVLSHYTKTSFASSGTLTFTAQTTPPTKPSSVDVDDVSWARDGIYADIFYRFNVTNATGGAAGSGDYIINLVSNITPDSSYTVFTGGTPATTFAQTGASLAHIESRGWIQNNSSRGNLADAFLYSSTQFRILAPTFYGSSQAWSSAQYPLNAIVQAYFKLRLRVSGWQP